MTDPPTTVPAPVNVPPDSPTFGGSAIPTGGQLGIDASGSIPTGAELQAAGIRNEMLYITPPGPGNKGITQAVWDDHTKHHVSIGLVWEEGNSAVRNGYNQGVADATRAQANLQALRGPDSKLPIYFAVDYDIQPSEYPLAGAYFHGANSVLGVDRTGVYGHSGIIEYLTQQHLVNKRWIAVGWQYHGIFKWHDIIQFRENVALGSGEVDYNHFYSANWGQLPATPAPAPTPTPNLNEENEMTAVLFKGDKSPDCFALVGGMKRHITGAEAAILTAAGAWHVTTVPQAAADAIKAV